MHVSDAPSRADCKDALKTGTRNEVMMIYQSVTDDMSSQDVNPFPGYQDFREKQHEDVTVSHRAWRHVRTRHRNKWLLNKYQ